MAAALRDALHNSGQDLGLEFSRGEDLAARRILERDGLIRLEGTVGNRRAIHGPTQKGIAWAQKHEVAVPSFHGGRCHYHITHKTVTSPTTPHFRAGSGDSVCVPRTLFRTSLVSA